MLLNHRQSDYRLRNYCDKIICYKKYAQWLKKSIFPTSGVTVFRICHNYMSGFVAALYRIIFLKAGSNIQIRWFLETKKCFAIFQVISIGVASILTRLYQTPLDKDKYAFPFLDDYKFFWMCQSLYKRVKILTLL